MKLPNLLLALGLSFLFLAIFSVAYAQDVTAAADPGAGLIPGLSVQHQLWVTWFVIAGKYLSEFYSSVRNGGGLKRILFSFWLGENLPKAVATDYTKELNTKPPFTS